MALNLPSLRPTFIFLIMTGTATIRDVSRAILIHEQASGGVLS